MSPLRSGVCRAAFVAGLLAGCSGGTPSVFLSLPLTSALERAGREGKVVFLEFGATWCGPCQRLAKTTLVDPRVEDWLRKKTVPLHFDIDDEPALATEFGVRGVPAMVFVRPDRTVLGAIVGYRTPDKLIEEGERRLQGVSAVEEAAAAVRERPGDLEARFRHFQELADSGKYQEALEEADYYWRESRKSMEQGGVRLSFFLGSMERLAGEHPPARKVLERWLGDATAELADKHGNALQATMEAVGLAKAVDRPEIVVQLAEKSQGMTLATVVLLAGDVLLKERCYQRIVDSGTCSPKAVKERLGLAKFGLQSARSAGVDGGDDTQAALAMAVLLPFEALAGVGREDEAMDVAKLVLGGAPDAAVRTRLADAAVRAGRPGLAKRIRSGE